MSSRENNVAPQVMLNALRRAAKAGFDEIDRGEGIVLTGQKALDRFFKEIQIEVQALARDGGRE